MEVVRTRLGVLEGKRICLLRKFQRQPPLSWADQCLPCADGDIADSESRHGLKLGGTAELIRPKWNGDST